MAHGDLLGKRYGEAIALAGWAVASWDEIVLFCLLNHLEPLELPVQHFFILIRHLLFDGLTEDGKKEVQYTLNEAARIGHPWLNKEHEKAQQPKGWTVDEKGKKIPPPGWTPPGWLDENTAYKKAKAAMKGVNARG